LSSAIAVVVGGLSHMKLASPQEFIVCVSLVLQFALFHRRVSKYLPPASNKTFHLQTILLNA